MEERPVRACVRTAALVLIQPMWRTSLVATKRVGLLRLVALCVCLCCKKWIAMQSGDFYAAKVGTNAALLNAVSKG